MKFLNPLIILSIIFNSILIYAQHNFNDVTIDTIKVSNNIYMLKGYGGNIGVFTGTDETFVIDSQFAPLSKKIKTVINSISNKPITYLTNTHYHGDHTGGNANFNTDGTTIIAHNNVRKHLQEPGRNGKIPEKENLPTITFNNELNFYFNSEHIAIFHVDNAHTDSDAVLYFTKSNVIHTGDTFFNDMYPYIDVKGGGSVNGYIKAIKKTLMLIDDDTKIIPGHGKLSNKKEYEMFLTMLETLKANVLKEIENGKAKEDIIANSEITKTYDDLGYSWNFINSERIRTIFYESLSKE